MRFGDSNVWKIGMAADVETRLGDLNLHIPDELLGRLWEVHLRYYSPVAATAYQLEQDILNRLNSSRTRQERVQCSEHDLIIAWRDAIAAGA